MSNQVIYSADLTAGSLKIRESRIIADLLLAGLSNADFQHRMIVENVLQTRSKETAIRLGKLIRSRLATMDAELWTMVRDSDQALTTQALLAAAVKHSALLRDFMHLSLRTEYRLLHSHISPSVWAEFLTECEGRDPAVAYWSDSTKKRLRSSVFQILTQAGYLGGKSSRELKKVVVMTEISDYLSGHGDTTVLRCLQLP